mgnify:CR=1 FL=1
MRGKLITIIGIVLVFGYFITESIRNNASDPTQIVIVGNDTLGRDWGAIAEQKLLEASQTVNSISSEDPESITNQNKNSGSLLDPSQDPYSKDKFNSSNYSTVQDASGREVIINYERPEEQEDPDSYLSRHQKEKGINQEPEIQYRD